MDSAVRWSLQHTGMAQFKSGKYRWIKVFQPTALKPRWTQFFSRSCLQLFLACAGNLIVLQFWLRAGTTSFTNGIWLQINFIKLEDINSLSKMFTLSKIQLILTLLLLVEVGMLASNSGPGPIQTSCSKLENRMLRCLSIIWVHSGPFLWLRIKTGLYTYGT